MASEIDICNMALGHLGQKSINSLTEARRESQLCKQFYAPTRDFVLRAHPWGFARRQQYLSVVSGMEPAGFEYAYYYPTECLLARKIHNPADEDTPIYFEVSTNPDTGEKVILTDYAQALLIYTVRVKDPLKFDPMFVDALAYKLAGDIAFPLTSKASVAETMFRSFQASLSVAQAVDGNESRPNPKKTCKYIRARR